MSEQHDHVADREVTGVTVSMEPGARGYADEVLLAIADALNISPEELPPLEDSVDPAKIEELFRNEPERRLRPQKMQFEYANLEVTVYSDQSIHLAPRE